MTSNASDDSLSEPNAASETLPVDHAFVCSACGHRWYYTRSRCPDCGAADPSTYELADGELVAWTDIAVTPRDVRSPNRVGLARFGDVTVIAQVDADSISVGDPVSFAGSHRLRDGTDADQPRLTPLESG